MQQIARAILFLTVNVLYFLPTRQTEVSAQRVLPEKIKLTTQEGFVDSDFDSYPNTAPDVFEFLSFSPQPLRLNVISLNQSWLDVGGRQGSESCTQARGCLVNLGDSKKISFRAI